MNNNIVDLTLNDVVVDVVDLTATTRIYKATVPGPPTPLARARFFRHRYVNLSKPKMRQFAAVIKEQLPQCSAGPLFARDEPVEICIWFLIPRPVRHFEGNRRALGRLKNSAKRLLFPFVRPDLDNLIKFVLDAVGGLVFVDDSQVVKLTACKIRDNEGLCEGATIVHFKEVNETTIVNKPN
jgi:Holliday junction resolvase RusA-like endonuclease